VILDPVILDPVILDPVILDPVILDPVILDPVILTCDREYQQNGMYAAKLLLSGYSDEKCSRR
jgi:hypothetical protein